MTIEKIEVAAYGFLIKDNKMLFVSNDGEYWYLPGGRQEPGEDLKTCLKREFHEETGIEIVCEDMVASMELIDPDFGKHKIMLFFRVNTESADLAENWHDVGSVKHRKFFSRDEALQNEKIVPRRIVTENFWELGQAQKFYFGHEPYTIKN